jgi:hypothetical protein
MQLHQARERRRKGEKVTAEQRERDILSDMEEELDQDLDDGRYRVSMVDWNRIDHARTVINTDLNDGNYDEDDSRPLSTRNLGLGRGIEVKMPKLKPKPASLPPMSPILDVPGPDQYKPTSLPPLKPTAMPPIRPELAASGLSSASLASSSTTIEPSSTTHTDIKLHAFSRSELVTTLI